MCLRCSTIDFHIVLNFDRPDREHSNVVGETGNNLLVHPARPQALLGAEMAAEVVGETEVEADHLVLVSG